MPLYQSKNIFVHIAKTGGQSVTRAMGGVHPITDEIELPDAPFKHHWTARELKQAYPEEFETHFKFSIIRHPLDRLVSEFGYFNSGRMGEKYRYWDSELIRSLPFTQFVYDVRDHCIVHPDQRIRCRYIPQYDYLYDAQGMLMVDKIFRFERFHEIEELVTKEGTRPCMHKNKSEHDPYMTYYTKETLSIVQDLYRKDFEVFGYDLIDPATLEV